MPFLSCNILPRIRLPWHFTKASSRPTALKASRPRTDRAKLILWPSEFSARMSKNFIRPPCWSFNQCELRDLNILYQCVWLNILRKKNAQILIMRTAIFYDLGHCICRMAKTVCSNNNKISSLNKYTCLDFDTIFGNFYLTDIRRWSLDDLF